MQGFPSVTKKLDGISLTSSCEFLSSEFVSLSTIQGRVPRVEIPHRLNSMELDLIDISAPKAAQH